MLRPYFPFSPFSRGRAAKKALAFADFIRSSEIPGSGTLCRGPEVRAPGLEEDDDSRAAHRGVFAREPETAPTSIDPKRSDAVTSLIAHE